MRMRLDSRHILSLLVLAAFALLALGSAAPSAP
jgi:hypothetical protein